jgi:hypothetical protein
MPSDAATCWVAELGVDAASIGVDAVLSRAKQALDYAIRELRAHL